MREPPTSRRSFWKSAWLWGAVVGVLGMLVVVLASGFMIETTNTDQFCSSCHMMEPFRESWQQSAHGGMNPQGFAAQCVDCHLPHGNFVEYVTTKAQTGIHDLVQSVLIDAATHDWRGNSEARRLEFTFDSSCHRCHLNLLSPTMKRGGWMAHRDYLNGFTHKRCVECHPHVGHRGTWEAVADHYEKPEKVQKF
jgi:cytochrome c-type protein NapC/trimethylamine-N-oxide reductase (cytochrome c) cytochrome c-type subunit TorY